MAISGNVPRLVSPDDSRDTFVLLRLGQCWPGHCEECCKVGDILLNKEKMDSGSSLDQLLNAEFKEAFNEFDKVCQFDGKYFLYLPDTATTLLAQRW